MKKLWMRMVPLFAMVCLLNLAKVPSVAFAEDYVLGPEDVVAVSVYLHPELDRVVAISVDGNVTVPPVGDIKAAGLSAKQLGERIADRLSAYLRQTTTVTVTVTQFMSRSVFVTGGVARPGRYGFERIPTLLDVLGHAGGALPGVDLSSVQILRTEGDSHRILSADLALVLRTGNPGGLPELKPGDTIVVPGSATQGHVSVSDGVGVLGEVAKPGVYGVIDGQDVWSLLASAGGLTVRGSLKDVRVITRADAGQNVTILNLHDVLEHGSRAPMTVKAGDVVVVMPRGSTAWTDFMNLLTVSRDALNVAVLVDYLRTHP